MSCNPCFSSSLNNKHKLVNISLDYIVGDNPNPNLNPRYIVGDTDIFELLMMMKICFSLFFYQNTQPFPEIDSREEPLNWAPQHSVQLDFTFMKRTPLKSS